MFLLYIVKFKIVLTNELLFDTFDLKSVFEVPKNLFHHQIEDLQYFSLFLLIELRNKIFYNTNDLFKE